MKNNRLSAVLGIFRLVEPALTFDHYVFDTKLLMSKWTLYSYYSTVPKVIFNIGGFSLSSLSGFF